MEQDEIDEEKLNYYIEGLKYWVNEGLKKAKVKYPDSYDAFYLFEKIDKEIIKLTNNLEIGDRVIVKWDYKRCLVEVKHTPSWKLRTTY